MISHGYHSRKIITQRENREKKRKLASAIPPDECSSSSDSDDNIDPDVVNCKYST